MPGAPQAPPPPAANLWSAARFAQLWQKWGAVLVACNGEGRGAYKAKAQAADGTGS
jgi:hypothetical protein